MRVPGSAPPPLRQAIQARGASLVHRQGKGSATTGGAEEAHSPPWHFGLGSGLPPCAASSRPGTSYLRGDAIAASPLRSEEVEPPQDAIVAVEGGRAASPRPRSRLGGCRASLGPWQANGHAAGSPRERITDLARSSTSSHKCTLRSRCRVEYRSEGPGCAPRRLSPPGSCLRARRRRPFSQSVWPPPPISRKP